MWKKSKGTFQNKDTGKIKKHLYLTEYFLDTGGPVVVSVNIYLRSISKIDDVNMEYSA